MEKQTKRRRRGGSRLLKFFVVNSIVVGMIVTQGMGTFPPNPLTYLLRDLVTENLPPLALQIINEQLVSVGVTSLPATDGVVDIFANPDALAKANENSRSEAANQAAAAAQQTAAANEVAAVNPAAATASAEQTAAANQIAAAQTANGTPNPATQQARANQTAAAQRAEANGTPNPATQQARANQTAAAQTAEANGTPNPATVSAQQTATSGGEEESPSEGGEKTATAPAATETATPQPTATAMPQTTATTQPTITPQPTATSTTQPTATNTPLPSTTLGQVGQPQHGQLIIGTNSLQYAPAPDFYGLDSFTYTVKGAVAARLSARQTSPIELTVLEDSPPNNVPIPPNPNTTDIIVTINVTVINVNDNPQALTDTFTLTEDTPTLLNVLANDSYLPDPVETLTLMNLSLPSHGLASIAGAEVLYTPTLNYAGSDGFTYTINDGHGGIATTVVNLTITNVNDLPQFVSVPVLTATENITYNYAIAAADVDLPSGDVLTMTALTLPAWLNLAPNGNNALLNGLPTNSEVGIHAVVLQLADAVGLTTQQSFDITVINVNNPPSFISSPLLTATQDVTYSYVISTTDLDLPYGDILALAVITAPSWLHLTNGILTGLPTNSDVATTTIALLVTDLNGLTATQTFSLTVLEANDPPTNTVPFTQTMLDHEMLVFGPAYTNTIFIADIDAGNNPLTVTFSVTQGTLTLSQTTNLMLVTGNGSPNLTFSGLLADLNIAFQSLSYSPIINSDGLFQLTMTTVDGGQLALSDSDTIAIIVQRINAAPQWTYPLTATVMQNTPLLFSVTNSNVIAVNDLDAGNGALQITMSITSGTMSLANLSGLTFSQGDGLTDTQLSFSGILTNLNIALNGLTYSPTLNYSGDTLLQLAVDDLGHTGLPGPLTDTVIITITVQPINAPPVVMGPGQQIVTEDVALVLAVTQSNAITVSDSDAGANPIAMTLSVMSGTLSLSQISGLTFTVGDGITDTTMTFQGIITDLNIALNGLVFSPTLNTHGLTRLNIMVDDLGYVGAPGPLSVTQTVVISITPMNDAPIITPTIFTTTEDTPLIMQVVGYDPEGDPLTYQAVSFPTVGSLIFSPSGAFTYTPPANWAGTDKFTYRANDGQLNSNIAVVTISVTPVNDPPVFVSTAILVAYQNITYTYYVTATDIDSNPVTLSAPTKPAWLTLVDNGNGTGVLTGTPPCGGATGNYPVILQTSDGSVSTLQSFSINLTNNLLVDNVADIDDANVTTGNFTLREAIAYACANDTITFAPALSGQTIILGSELLIDKDLTISGTVPMMISGNNTTRVFQVTAGNVTFNSLTITGGNPATSPAPAGIGGGIHTLVGTTVTVNNSTLINNTASQGAAMFNTGVIIVNNSTVATNTATGWGGGLSSDGTIGTATMVNNSTFYNNTATNSGGAIAVNYAGIYLKNVTFDSNQRTIYIANSATLTATNSIISNNTAGNMCTLAFAAPTIDAGATVNNLIQDVGSTCTGLTDGVNGNKIGAAYNPLLGPLANNGGNTQTMALFAGSPAANAGDNATCLTTDQRGVARPIGATCDIGAYESDQAPIAGHFNGLNLDGMDNNILLPSNAALNFSGGSNLSIEMWIKTSAVDDANLFTKPDAAAGSGVQYVFGVNAGGTLQLSMDDHVGGGGWSHISGVTTVNTGLWTHVALSKSGCNINFYVNGIAAGSGTVGGAQCTSPSSTNQATLFFSPLYGSYFNGQADEIRLWNTARTQTEIQANMGRALIGDEVGLLGYWQLEEGSGTTANDTTANALHGTLQNFVATDWIKTTQTVGPAWRILSTVTLNNTLPSYEPEGQGVTYSIVSNGSQGVATITNASTGAFTYVPNSGASGVDTFTYKVNDGTSDSNVQTATVELISLVVSTLADTIDGNFSLGQNSLREAIANASAGSMITFDATISGGTITLGSELAINKSLTISSTIPITISGNNLVRVFNVGASATNVTFDGLGIANGNAGAANGGGIYVASSASTVTINNSTLSNNAATVAAGLHNNGGTVIVSNSTVNNNISTWDVGGLFNYLGTMTINNSTIANNSAVHYGGGLFNQGVMNINNSTVSGNSAVGGGGANGGGIYNWSGGTLYLRNTIIANSTNGDCVNGGTIATNINNLIKDGSCNVGTTLSGYVSGEPNLGPLANNGGSTLTMIPSACSPAINAAGAGALTTDQTGQAAVGTRDIGAFEYQTASTSPITVLNTTDSGPGSLRDAICLVTAGGIIDFTPALTGQTITLSSAQLDINKNMTISGTVPITISGDNAVRVFYVGVGLTNVVLDGLSVINGNSLTYGAGLDNRASTVTINNSTFANNNDTNGGGGAITNIGGTLVINNSTFYNNSAGGGNSGGAVESSGTLTIQNSTFANNSSTNLGGAVSFVGTTLTIKNSTFSGNNATTNGRTFYLTAGATHIYNTIMANGTGGGSECAGAGLTTNTNNLIETGTCGGAITSDPQLGPLQNNGGNTQTMQLLAGSPAIDAGNNGTCLATDQRGIARPRNGICDLGAFEGDGSGGLRPAPVELRQIYLPLLLKK